MGAHRLFCDISILSEIIRLRKERPYSTVFSIIDKLSDIYLECEDNNQIKKLAFSNPIINKLIKRPNRQVLKVESIKKEISSAYADDIYLLLPPFSSSYSDYKDKHGLLVTKSLTDLQFLDDLCYKHYRPFNLLTEDQKKRLTDNGEEFEDISSWREIFNELKITPINSAVIIDNYLFTHFDRRKTSLYRIIGELVPPKLKVPFHLTIFINNQKNEIKKRDMEQVITEIHNLKLGSPILVSIIAHTVKATTHDRHILTNYHLITSGKGFGAIDFRGVKENIKGEIVSTFHNIEYINSHSSIKNQHSILLDWMKDIYIDRKGMEALYAFEVGDNFQNRLLS